MKRFESVQDLLHTQLDNDASKMGAALNMIIQNQNLKEALITNNRNLLIEQSMPLFDNLHANYGITHFYYSDAKRVNMLRVHNPEKNGDVIDRITTLEAEMTEKLSRGIELGPLGTLTLRVVMPVHDEDRLIGFVELGEEIDHIIQKLKMVLNVELFLMIKKEFLERDKWETGMRMLGREANWEHYRSVVMSGQTLTKFPVGLVQFLDEEKHFSGMTDVEVSLENRIYRSRFLDLKDAGGRDVGDLVILLDTTRNIKNLNAAIYSVSVFCIVIGAALFIIFFILVDRLEGKLFTAQKKILALERDRSRFIIENTPSHLSTLDAHGCFTQWNAYSEKLFGYSAGEAIGKLGPEHLMRNPEEIQDMKIIMNRDGFVEREVNARNKEGQTYRIKVRLVEMHELDGTTGLLCHAEDVTDRRRAEDRLRESEERYRGLVETCTDAIVSVNEERQIIQWNKAASHIFGYSESEIINKPVELLISDEYMQKYYESFNRFFETEEGKRIGQTLSLSCIHESGRIIPIELSLSVLKMGGSWIYTAIMRDITIRKKEEKEKEKLQAKLQQAQKMEAIGTLAGGVAHDLNNILSGIVSYPDLLLLQISEESPLRKPILTIKESGIKAAAIVQDLLTLARRGVCITEVVDLNSIILEYLQSPEYERLRSEHIGMEVETRLENNLMHILGSPVHLSKTIMNLVSNGAEAMLEGKKLFISTENRYVDKPIGNYEKIEEGDYVVLTVSDNGSGISADDMGKIFEPFFTKKKMGRSGTGLGMAVVWGTVKDHHGYIDVRSTEGKGTTFMLYFPVTRQQMTPKSRKISHNAYFGKGESILVVDDVKEQRDIASCILKELGYSVFAVSCGEEAVQYLKNGSADLLLLDMIMEPDMDGLETYRQILQTHPNQRAIVASGFSQTERVREAQKLGVGQYLKKPYTIETIGMAVRSELNKRSLSI